MTRARRYFLAHTPRSTSFGVGKWSRIATYGCKRQRQPDGSWSETLFDDAKFSQWLTNFLLMFAGRGRGMGSDCEHQTIYAAVNGKPAENLAYFTGLCWVRGSQVVATSRLQPSVPALDPQAESARLQAEHPATRGNPDGVWAYCAEITPRGAEVIPNYSQLSPLVSDDEHLEDATPIGSALLNVSFVNVSHQVGTNFAFSNGGGPMDITPDEMRKKLSAFGLGEKPDAEALRKALAAYMETTEDNPATRGAMAKACAKALGELEIVHTDDDDSDDDDKAAASTDKAAMGKQLAAMSHKLTENERELAALRKRAADADLADCLTEARRRGVEADRVKPFFAKYGKDETLVWLKNFTKPVSALGRWSQPTVEEPSDAATPISVRGGVPIIGASLSVEAKKLLEAGTAKTIEQAQVLAFRKNPRLYRNDQGAA